MSDTEQPSLSIPSLLAFALVSFLVIRWFFFSSPSDSTNSTLRMPQAGQRERRHNFAPARVDQLSSMFPQLSRKEIEWDLVQNGGSVQATTERVLMTGRLPQPPPNFTPLYAAPPPSATSSGPQQPRSRQNYQDLITRYNLSSKVAASSQHAEVEESDKQKEKGGWSSNKTERQALLKRRREEMILEARRKLEERERKGKAPA